MKSKQHFNYLLRCDECGVFMLSEFEHYPTYCPDCVKELYKDCLTASTKHYLEKIRQINEFT